MGKLERRILMGVLLGVLVYAGIGLLTDARRLVGHLAEFPTLVFTGALGLTLVNYGLRFGRWHYYLRHLDIDVPLGESLNVFLAGFVMSVTPGKIGEVLKSFLLRESRGVSAARTAPIVLAERITDLLGMFVIAGVGVITFEYGRTVFGLSLAAVVGLVVVLSHPTLVEKLLDFAERVPLLGARLRDRWRAKIEDSYHSMQQLLDAPALTWATVLSVLAWTMEGIAFFWILEALGASDATLYQAFFVYAITTILGAVSFLPGGLGVTEGSMIGVLLLFGIFQDESLATVATYLIRFATLWFGVLVGFVALMRYRVRHLSSRPLESDSNESLDDDPQEP